jgi:23S rRNA pseudouridine1911/1915/1917 synthase
LLAKTITARFTGVNDPRVFEGPEIFTARGTRLDQFLAAELGESRSHVQRLIDQGKVRLEPLRPSLAASDKLRKGDRVIVEDANVTPPPSTLVGEKMDFNILHEDKDILILNKPPGLVVHPAAGHWTGTLVHGLIAHLGESFEAGESSERPGIVHRLDKETSGLMVIAKHHKAHANLVEQFQERQITKQYLALAWGVFKYKTGDCKGSIGRSPRQRQKMAVLKEGGKEAHTRYRVTEQFKDVALVECDLFTGRTHQIRVHLAEAVHPIVGDTVYGRTRNGHGLTLPGRQMLHAWKLGFSHPRTRKAVEFCAPLPDDFQSVLDQLHARPTA